MPDAAMIAGSFFCRQQHLSWMLNTVYDEYTVRANCANHLDMDVHGHANTVY
jgi:hypothetical protein